MQDGILGCTVSFCNKAGTDIYQCASLCPFIQSRLFPYCLSFCWENWSVHVTCQTKYATPLPANVSLGQHLFPESSWTSWTGCVRMESGDGGRWQSCTGCKERANTSLWIKRIEISRQRWNKMNVTERKKRKKMARQVATIYKRGIQLHKTWPGCSPNY